MSARIIDLNSPSQFLPPQNIEAEAAVLGGILLDPNAMARVADILTPDAFYTKAHAQVYRAAQALHTASEPVDLLSVAHWLADNNLLDAVGGKRQLVQLVDQTVTAINIDYLAQLVAEKAVSRQMIAVGHDVIRLGYDQTEDLTTRLDASEQLIFALRQQKQGSNQPQSIDGIAVSVFQQLEHISTTGELPAIATGFYDLDNLLAGGFYPGDLIIVGARPSVGKSCYASSLAYQIADIHRTPTLIFSLEMDKDSIVKRYLSNLASIEGKKLRQGRLSSDEWSRILQGIEALSHVRVLIDDSGCPSVQEIRSKVRSTISQHGGLKLVVIDYLQLMVDSSDNNLVQRLGEITRQLKLLAKECQVPIVLLSQLNRGVEERNDKRPVQSDLRASGRLEEDADLILFLYRDVYYNCNTSEPDVMEIICTKHRNGPTGTVKLLFDGTYSRLRNLATGRG